MIGETITTAKYRALDFAQFMMNAKNPNTWIDKVTVMAIGASGNLLMRGPKPESLQDVIMLDAKTLINLERGWFEFLHGQCYAEDLWCEYSGINIHRIPLSSFHAPRSWEVGQFLETVDKCLEHGNVYFHCAEGRDRTGYMAAKYRLRRMNWKYDDAVKEMIDMGFHQWRYAGWLSCL